jgi:hypothetical protein
VEPVTTSGVSLAKALTAIKDLPLWLFAATALSLAAFLCVPIFADLAPKETRLWVALAALVFGILWICRLTSIGISTLKKYQERLEKHRTFHLTPLEQKCHWGASLQPDGTIITHLIMVMDAKNRTGMALTILTARLIKPKISGEIMNNFILIENRGNNERRIPPHAVRSIVVNMSVRGVPKQRTGKVQPLPVLLSVYDDEGNEQRVRLRVRPLDPNATASRA